MSAYSPHDKFLAVKRTHPDDIGSFTLHGDLSFPFTITFTTASNALSNFRSSTIASEEVLCANSPLLMSVDILKDDFDWVCLG